MKCLLGCSSTALGRRRYLYKHIAVRDVIRRREELLIEGRVHAQYLAAMGDHFLNATQALAPTSITCSLTRLPVFEGIFQQ
jgi:hypothetical protein